MSWTDRFLTADSSLLRIPQDFLTFWTETCFLVQFNRQPPAGWSLRGFGLTRGEEGPDPETETCEEKLMTSFCQRMIRFSPRRKSCQSQTLFSLHPQNLLCSGPDTGSCETFRCSLIIWWMVWSPSALCVIWCQEAPLVATDHHVS